MEMRRINRLFGEEPFHQEPGFVRWRYQVSAAHHNPQGALHGGVMSTLLDSAMGHAVWTLVSADGVVHVAVTLSVAFLKPVRGEGQTLVVEGRVQQRGRRMAFTEGVVLAPDGGAVARATATWALTPVG